MYDWTFFLFIWLLVTVVGIPTILITTIIIVINRIRQNKLEANTIERKLQNIDFLLSLIKADSSDANKQMALDAFNKNFSSFDGLEVKSPEFQKRMQFITNFALLDFFDIDRVAKFADSLSMQNRNYKKEIEHAIGGALKTRQKRK